MHNRIIAFFISSNKTTAPSYKRAVNHLQKLAKSFSKKISVIELEKYHLHLVYEGELEKLLIKENETVKFCVGPHTSRKNSGWDFSFENRTSMRDRFLHISIDHQKITISNDYIGAIPAYYSLRKNVSISNIEPVVVLDSDSSYDDLSPESVYILLRYTHFIGTETFYRHIKTQEPDSTFIFTNTSQKAKVKYHNSIKSSEDRIKMKSSDIVDELAEVNRRLVHEALCNEEDIILSLSSGYDSRMILAAATEDRDIKAKLRCYTYMPNMSLETRPAEELCKTVGVNWEKINLPRNTFSTQRLKQIGLIFGSGLHVHGKYKLDFIDQIKHNFKPEESVITEGFMTEIIMGSSFLCDRRINTKKSLIETMDSIGTYKYTKDDYLLAHSRILNRDMKHEVELKSHKIFDRFDGPAWHKMIMFDIYTRHRNFYSYQPRVIECKIPYIAAHVTPEFLNFTLSLPPHMMRHRKAVEMMFAKHYPAMNRASTNSNLTVKNILKCSIARPHEAMRHYAPLLIKYFFKQPCLLPKSYIAEMKDPVVPDLRCIGKDGVFPLFEMNAESNEIFNEYFDLNEVNNLFNNAMTGDELSTKRLMILETLACALKMLEK